MIVGCLLSKADEFRERLRVFERGWEASIEVSIGGGLRRKHVLTAIRLVVVESVEAFLDPSHKGSLTWFNIL